MKIHYCHQVGVSHGLHFGHAFILMCGRGSDTEKSIAERVPRRSSLITIDWYRHLRAPSVSLTSIVCRCFPVSTTVRRKQRRSKRVHERARGATSIRYAINPRNIVGTENKTFFR